ncbi:MAG TPA: DUF262 domain-containing protein [bacterium]|nr:DUF262 domain-containing protein [bacterium]
MMPELGFVYGDKTIQEFVLLFENGQLNLEPGFQRDSVWTLSDRKKLIESIFHTYPMPSVFLYKRTDGGKLQYDVIDGKQRLESILMFQGCGRFRGKRFSVKSRFDQTNCTAEWDWKKVRQRQLESRIMEYRIQTVEVSGDLSDIIDLFVRINSTGKRLTGQEKRHARFFHSDFLKQAGKLAERHKTYFIENRVLSIGEISRMKHIELVCELMASIHSGGPINKKAALDSIIGGEVVDSRSLKKCVQQFIRILNIMKRMFPDLRTTRFANSVDWYSLFMLVWEMDKAGCILNNVTRNRQAQVLLIELSIGVDTVRQLQRKAEGAGSNQRLFADYLLTVQGNTDSLPTRKRRADLLRQLLGGIFEEKDDQRNFTIEQRRLIWHSEEKKKCADCGETLTWNNFTIDHRKPYSRGGRTSPANAQLMCRKHNSMKGAR